MSEPDEIRHCVESGAGIADTRFDGPQSANPYGAFWALVPAGLDGIERGLDPAPRRPSTCSGLRRRRRCHRCRARGASRWTRPSPITTVTVFTEDLIRTWIDVKRENDVDPVRLAPHPPEFSLSLDC